MTPRPGCRVVHVATGHRPHDPRIHGRECRTLAAAGYEVVLVTPADAPTDLGAVRHVRIPVPRSRAARMLVTPVRAWWAATRRHGDLYHLHDANLLPGAVVMALAGKRVVYDAHEDLLATVRDRGWIPAPLRPLVAGGARLVERLAVRLCAAVVCAEPAAAPRFPADKTTVLANYPVLDELDGRRAPGGPVGVYVGDLNRQRGARQLVAAFGRLPADLDARLVIGGRLSGHGLVDELATLEGWSRVEFRGWLSRTEVADLLASARFGVVTFLASPSQEATQPVKLFEYLAAGLPVVASDFPLWRELLGDPPAGILVDPADPSAIATAVEWLLAHPEEADAMGRRGRAAVEARYHWGVEAPKLLALYARLLPGAVPIEAGP